MQDLIWASDEICLYFVNNPDMLMELSRREKAANIKPDAHIDAFMKARSRRPMKHVLSTFLIKRSRRPKKKSINVFFL